MSKKQCLHFLALSCPKMVSCIRHQLYPIQVSSKCLGLYWTKQLYKILPVWPVVFFPAGTVSTLVPPERLLPAPVIKGQLCVMAIWVQELKAGAGQAQQCLCAHSETPLSLLPIGVARSHYFHWQQLFGNSLFFPISVSNYQFQPKRIKQAFLSSATLPYIVSIISNSSDSCIVLHENKDGHWTTEHQGV